MLDALDRRLLNDFQRGFPLVERPFAAIASRVGASEGEVLERFRRLARDQIVSRIGVVYRPNAAGASTLIALRVPPASLDQVAAYLDAQPEINHSYEREHRLNLWVVLTAPSQALLDAALARIKRATGISALSLPLLEEFHIDLGFDLRTGAAHRAPRRARGRIDESQRPLVAALQEGLPLVRQPFARVGRAAGMAVTEVLQAIGRWLEMGFARRIGVVVRHRLLGYEANAMVVWNVPDAQAGVIGGRLAAEDGVTLCYLRPRVPPDWPYNLFCMIHGRERAAVMERIDGMRRKLGLEKVAHEVLFSRRCFTQRGARYAAPAQAAHG